MLATEDYQISDRISVRVQYYWLNPLTFTVRCPCKSCTDCSQFQVMHSLFPACSQCSSETEMAFHLARQTFYHYGVLAQMSGVQLYAFCVLLDEDRWRSTDSPSIGAHID